MAFQKVQNRDQNFDGFFDYVEGNVLQGTVKHTVITGKNDSGGDKGYIGVEVEIPCKAGMKDKDTKEDRKFDAVSGQVIALSITSGTRILMGTEGKRVRCTFNKFIPSAKGKYHDWTIEIDDGTK